MKGSWLLGPGLALGAFLLGPVSAPAAPAVVTAIFAGTYEGRFQLEIRGSEPLDYVVIEGADPFSVSLLLLNTTFAFPSEESQLPGPGLTRIRTAVLEREGSRLGRLDLTFAQSAPYRVIKDGTRILVRVDAPPLPRGLVLGAPGREPLAAPRPAQAPAPTDPGVPPGYPARVPETPAAVPLIIELRPEIVGDDVRVIVQADGPLAYKSFVMEKPSRVVVDFERAQLTRAEETIEVGNAILKRIRASQFSRTSVRVVLDLTGPRPFWIEAQAEGVVIHLGTARRP